MIKLKHVAAPAVAAAAAAAALAAGGASGAAKQPSSAQDQTYLKTAIEGDRFEVDGGKAAAAKTQNAAVKTLAARLVKDHGKSVGDATKLARKIGMKAPQSPSPSEQWELQIVGALNGKAFDHWYSLLEVQDHKQDIEETQFEASHGSNAAVRADAKKELPTLKQHLKLAKQALAASPG